MKKSANPDYIRVRAIAWLILQRALRATDRHDEADLQHAHAARWAAALAHMPVTEIYIHLGRAEQTLATDQPEHAWRAFDHALNLAERTSVPADIAAVIVSYGTALLRAGQKCDCRMPRCGCLEPGFDAGECLHHIGCLMHPELTGSLLRIVRESLNKLIPIMVRQAHHERNQQHTVRPRIESGAGPEPVEGACSGLP